MSNTRKAPPGSGFYQQAFSSSPQFGIGLMANLVARRCEVLDSAEHRELIWFLQLLSHREGGLSAVAQALMEKHPDCNVKQSKPRCRKERQTDIISLLEELSDGVSTLDYAANGLPKYLAQMCVDPALAPDKDPWWFIGLFRVLRDFQADWIEQRRRAGVVTEIGQKVFDELDYSLEEHCMVVVLGVPRIGKSHSAKAWAELHPGRARYLEVPSSNDEISFCSAIGKSLGLSIPTNAKAHELRHRIEDTLQRSKLMVIFDEGLHLWPTSIDTRSLPARINWINTALVNRGVPVAILAIPDFIETQKLIETKTRWRAAQFIGRIGHCLPLPNSLEEPDLFAVAKITLPEGDAASIEMLVRYAQGSAQYLAAIESVARRARFLAKRSGRDEATSSDVRHAIKTGVIPSDSFIAAAMSDAAKPAGKRQSRSIAAPLQPAFSRAETPLPTPPVRRDLQPLTESRRTLIPESENVEVQ